MVSKMVNRSVKQSPLAFKRKERERADQVQDAFLLLIQAERDRATLAPIFEQIKKPGTNSDAYEALRDYVRNTLLPAN